MSWYNEDAFLRYYNSATKNANVKYEGMIFDTILAVNNHLSRQFRLFYPIAGQNWLDNNMTTYKKTFKATLMQNGMPVKTADTLLRHFTKWWNLAV